MSKETDPKASQIIPNFEILMTGSDKIIERIERRMNGILVRNKDILDASVFHQVIEREKAYALGKYAKDRFEGNANDQGSSNPGMTIYLTPEGYKTAIKICQEAGYLSISRNRIKEISPILYSIYFPKGLFGMDEAAYFNQQIGKSGRPEKPFSLSFNKVVRVEGVSGELWQNKTYTWDGSPKF